MPAIISALTKRPIYGRRFIYDSSLRLYLPLGHPDLSGSPFISKDLNALSCTVFGATWGITGRTLDGIDNKIDCGNNSVLNFTASAFAISMWLNPDLTATRRVFTRGDYNVMGYLVQITNAGVFQLYTNQAGVSQGTISAVGTVVANTWQHLMCVRDGATVKLYKNGVDLNAATGTHINPVTSTASFLIGVDEDAGNWYKGIIGEVGVWSRAPSASEAMHIYETTKGRYI